MATGHLPTFIAVEFNYFFSYDKALYVEIRVVCTCSVWCRLKIGKNCPICYRSVDEIPFSLENCLYYGFGEGGSAHMNAGVSPESPNMLNNTRPNPAPIPEFQYQDEP
ncbi:hypothetical protein NPIL_340381 [Nephila pilipes]|uniref:Uncharacterized protein n=1 Tax=Nephila pilipes TaxID=299642 RepID=A0A8X6NJF5_NEPPI|nr:hypothetical protein NPIL_340381 [Nephila pilipes]